jgi:hypothetical protein
MHRRRKFNDRYLEFALILTIVIIALYIFIFIYSTNGDTKTLKLTSDACKDFGGTCHSKCTDNEIQKTRCGDELVCCVEIFPESPDDRLYLKIGLNENNLEHCNNILDLEMKASCKLQIMDNLNSNFALTYKDSKYCELIGNQNKNIECLISLAKSLNNEQICQGISSLSSKNKCIKDLAISKKDSNICLDINYEISKNSCINEIAVDTNLPSLCDQITMQIERNQCKLKIELKNLKLFPKCINLPESKCITEQWCEPLYFYPDCDGCPRKAFEICLPNNDLICESSGGSWNILKSTCNCQGEVWYDGSGCFKCNKFTNPYSIADCESKLI